MPFNKPVRAIRRKVLRMILEASRDMYPREFGAILRAEDGVITEILLVPGTVSGNRHAIFQLHMLPADFTVVGTVHSHPSGNFHPSDEDLALFGKFGGLHLIVGYPYDETSWAAWKHSGERLDLQILP
jgi:proteasome lid subunit RPN8/RPN11